MKSHRSNAGDDVRRLAEEGGFSLVLGGPLYQLLIRIRATRPPVGLLYRRLLVLPVLAWLPLLVLSLLDGWATGGVATPFLSDLATYARFLIAMPILILAEPFAHYRLRDVIHQFKECRVIPAAVIGDFDRAIASAMKLRNSKWVEIAILILAFVVGPYALQQALLALGASAWHSNAEAGRLQLTRAGWWFVHVSAPLFQFLLLRWYFRLLVWWRLLWQISRLPLELQAAHFDRAGGIGFLGYSVWGLMPVLFAQGVLMSGVIANRVLGGIGTASSYLAEITVLVAMLGISVIGPLFFFSHRMAATRRQSMRSYGALAAEHGVEFEGKWLRDRRPTDEALLGNPDFSSLADVAGGSDVVRQMKPFPFDMRVFIELVAATAVPFLPLVLTEIPFSELVRRVLKMMV